MFMDKEEAEHQLNLMMALAMGDRLERASTDKANPFSVMIDRSRAEYVQATRDLIFADLHTPDGIAKAIRLQAEARRYENLCIWVADIMEAASQAEDDLTEEIDGDEIQKLKDQMNGNGSKPAPDA